MSGVDDLAGPIHGRRWLLATHLDDDGTVVEAHGEALPATLIGHTPGPLEVVSDGLLEPVGVGMPDLDGAVLRARDDDG